VLYWNIPHDDKWEQNIGKFSLGLRQEHRKGSWTSVESEEPADIEPYFIADLYRCLGQREGLQERKPSRIDRPDYDFR
jgi:hypothetical protein